jgi:ABC-type transporter Mla MlaB component
MHVTVAIGQLKRETLDRNVRCDRHISSKEALECDADIIPNADCASLSLMIDVLSKEYLQSTQKFIDVLNVNLRQVFF